ncbi:MAG TPA: hypothetical protein EYP36_10625 [Calditrichaeota bacterium]|nr:hypothetical protein [Calditrichota bacterium]
MLNDAWIIVILLGQSSALLLTILSVYFALPIMRYWEPGGTRPLQIELERKTFFVSTAAQYILVFQFIIFFAFLFTINSYLPLLITGAMCASGILSLSVFGYPALYIKIAALILCLIFIFLNRLDMAEPGYPLTPDKYYVLPIILVFLLTDTYITIRFFSEIKADVIATCCSISFSAGDILQKRQAAYFIPANYTPVLYYLSFTAFLLLILRSPAKLKTLFFLELIHLPLSVLVLKYQFVKYIYALPSHDCLFDLFFPQYYVIGYLLFAALFISFTAVVWLNILRMVENRLSRDFHFLKKRLYRIALGGNVLFILIVHLYWAYWKLIILE